jgi:hypothetical protein
MALTVIVDRKNIVNRANIYNLFVFQAQIVQFHLVIVFLKILARVLVIETVIKTLSFLASHLQERAYLLS